MRGMKYVYSVLLCIVSLNAMQEQQMFLSTNPKSEKRHLRLKTQSLIPDMQSDMQDETLIVAQANAKVDAQKKQSEPTQTAQPKATIEQKAKQEAVESTVSGTLPTASANESAKISTDYVSTTSAPQATAAKPTAAAKANSSEAQSAATSFVKTTTFHNEPKIVPVIPKTPITQKPPPQVVVKPIVEKKPVIAHATSSQNIPSTSQGTASQSQAQEDQEVNGIDTVDIDEPQGNWLLKRIWWQRGQSLYEKVKATVASIMDARMAFFAKRTEWDRKVFDPFYLEVGLGRGVLEELVASLMKRIEDEQSKQGDLNPEERSVLGALETEKKTIEELHKDVLLINEIDGRIDDMITLLIEQINKARSYENQSWQNLKDIAQELNDKKARELFYTISNNWQNINDIGGFIQSQFSQSFDQLGQQAQQQIEKVKTTIQSLKEKGIDLKQQWQEIEDKSKIDKDQEKLEQERAEQEQEAIRKKKEEEAKRGFLSKLWHRAVSVVSTVYNYVKTGISSVWDFTIGRFFKKPVKTNFDDAFVNEHSDVEPKDKRDGEVVSDSGSEKNESLAQ